MLNVKQLQHGLTIFAMIFCGYSTEVVAKEGQFGILEGRTFAMIHPVIMLVLFVASGYTAYLGTQISRTRDIANEIKYFISSLYLKLFSFTSQFFKESFQLSFQQFLPDLQNILL